MSARFRLMTRDDIPAGMRLKDLAGWNQTVLDWERFLSASPAGCFVAECDGRVVGTSTTIVYEGRVAWIGMVVVEPQHRGQGIGTALLARAIRYLDSRSVPAMKLDATPEGKTLYENRDVPDLPCPLLDTTAIHVASAVGRLLELEGAA